MVALGGFLAFYGLEHFGKRVGEEHERGGDAVIVNAAIMELPEEKDGRFVAFAIGSPIYALILVAL